MSRDVYCFLDTSILIECQFFPQIDWRTELQARQVCLIIAPAVIDELENFKTDPRSERRRNKARSVLARFIRDLGEAAWSEEGASVRDGVRLRLLTSEAPEDRFEKHNLTHRLGDDRIMASAIRFGEDCPSTALLTADYGLYARARARGIDARLASEGIEEKDETTAETRRIRQLEQRIVTLEQQIADPMRVAVDPRQDLAEAVRQAPVPPDERYSYLHLVVRPVTSDRSLMNNAESRWSPGGERREYLKLLGHFTEEAAAEEVFPEAYYPQLPTGLPWERRAGAWQLQIAHAGDGEQVDPGSVLLLRVSADGGGYLFCGRAGERDRHDRLQMFETNIAALTTRFLYLLGLLYRVAGYEDVVDVGLAVTGIESGISSQLANTLRGWDAAGYDRPAYEFFGRFQAIDLWRHPRRCAETLTEELFGELTGDTFSPFQGLSSWQPREPRQV